MAESANFQNQARHHPSQPQPRKSKEAPEAEGIPIHGTRGLSVGRRGVSQTVVPRVQSRQIFPVMIPLVLMRGKCSIESTRDVRIGDHCGIRTMSHNSQLTPCTAGSRQRGKESVR